ncbi:uncharacterized protein LOC62_01G001548 [Vanrija pseudolonga]|uniref:Ricin B lectin domain-containing protein n=1 Tax=Vanrija pseudolonga TaxID=143232 RepID=A0AAF1BFF7_9TREE|nr:hypothetical protein LOC62_01G001548 [Vanrija pseudolonga]
MRLLALALPLVAASSALASTISELDKRYVTQEGSFMPSWAGEGYGALGVTAQFACCGLYNYSEIPSGQPIRIAKIQAPKFFFPTFSEWAGKPSLIGLGGPRKLHCMDVGESPRDGTTVRLQDCDINKRGQRWRILLNTYDGGKGKVRLADTDLCFDVPDGNSTNNLQVWTCYKWNKNQDFTFSYHKKQ